MKKSDVYEYMENNDLESQRFILDKGNGNQVVVQVENCTHFCDLMVVEIWHGEPLGNQCYLGGYGTKEFTVTDDSMSSEMLMDDEEDEDE